MRRVILCNKDFDWMKFYKNPEFRQDWLSFPDTEADSDSIYAWSGWEDDGGIGDIVETTDGRALQATSGNYRPSEDGDPSKDKIRYYDRDKGEWIETGIRERSSRHQIEVYPDHAYHWMGFEIGEEYFDSYDGLDGPIGVWIDSHKPVKIYLSEM